MSDATLKAWNDAVAYAAGESNDRAQFDSFFIAFLSARLLLNDETGDAAMNARFAAKSLKPA